MNGVAPFGAALILLAIVMGAVIALTFGIVFGIKRIKKNKKRSGIIVAGLSASLLALLLLGLFNFFGPPPIHEVSFNLTKPFDQTLLGNNPACVENDALQAESEACYLGKFRYRMNIALPDGRLIDATARDVRVDLQSRRTKLVGLWFRIYLTPPELISLLHKEKEAILSQSNATSVSTNSLDELLNKLSNGRIGAGTIGAASACQPMQNYRLCLRVEKNDEKISLEYGIKLENSK